MNCERKVLVVIVKKQLFFSLFYWQKLMWERVCTLSIFNFRKTTFVLSLTLCLTHTHTHTHTHTLTHILSLFLAFLISLTRWSFCRQKEFSQRSSSSEWKVSDSFTSVDIGAILDFPSETSGRSKLLTWCASHIPSMTSRDRLVWLLHSLLALPLPLPHSLSPSLPPSLPLSIVVSFSLSLSLPHFLTHVWQTHIQFGWVHCYSSEAGSRERAN